MYEVAEGLGRAGRSRAACRAQTSLNSETWDIGLCCLSSQIRPDSILEILLSSPSILSSQHYCLAPACLSVTPHTHTPHTPWYYKSSCIEAYLIYLVTSVSLGPAQHQHGVCAQLTFATWKTQCDGETEPRGGCQEKPTAQSAELWAGPGPWPLYLLLVCVSAPWPLLHPTVLSLGPSSSRCAGNTSYFLSSWKMLVPSSLCTIFHPSKTWQKT